MADPKFVRLVDRMVRSTQVDLRSGWSIAGLDVREFPGDDERLAQNYVRDAIRRGTIEGCSQAEYEEVYGEDGSNLDFLARSGVKVKQPEIEGHVQAAHIQGLADTERHRIEAARGLSSSGENFSDEKVRKAAVLRAQRAQEAGEEVDEADAAGESDDEELQQSSDAEETPAPARGRRKAAAK